MSKAFLDPSKPLATCTATSCAGCPVGETVTCHFNGKQLVHFFAIAMPLFLIGGAGIFAINPWWLIPYFILILGYFGFVEIRTMCSHCPHYAEDGPTLQCWANYGVPRLWKYRPGPMSAVEKSIFSIGMAIVFFYPIVFLLIGWQWFYLLLYSLTLFGGYRTLRELMCAHCMNFACPLNQVDQEIREEFFKKNPIVANAWKQENTNKNK